MISRHFLSLAALIAISFGGLALGNSALAQDGQGNAAAKHAAGGMDRVRLFDSVENDSKATKPADVRKSPMSVSELRQARALYRANQRVARLEYNLWMGYEPLRPNWNSIPMTSSRYAPRRIYVPVYVHSR